MPRHRLIEREQYARDRDRLLQAYGRAAEAPLNALLWWWRRDPWNSPIRSGSTARVVSSTRIRRIQGEPRLRIVFRIEPNEDVTLYWIELRPDAPPATRVL